MWWRVRLQPAKWVGVWDLILVFVVNDAHEAISCGMRRQLSEWRALRYLALEMLLFRADDNIFVL